MEICKRCKYKSTCSSSSESDFCLNYEALPLTNADRIRAMTDEELADWFSSIAEEAVKHGGKIKSSCWLDWLKEESE